ncbi:MAG: tetratricopeptide repeat protein [Janthinobacterium lividum]
MAAASSSASSSSSPAAARSSAAALSTVVLERALQAHRAGRLDEAERAYQSILATVPVAVPSSARIAALSPTAAQAGAASAGDTDLLTDARYWLGVLYLQQHRADAAQTCFRDVLARRPEHDAARLNLGHALQRLGDGDAACREFACATRAAIPDIVAAAHTALAQYAAAAGRPADALRHFDQALAITPAQASLHDSRGIAFAALGQHADAEQAHRAALAIRPQHAGTHNNLGLAVKAQGSLDEALWHFRDALRVDPNFVPALVNLGQAVSLGGDPDQASAPLERAVRLAPEFVPAHHELASAYAALDRQEDAVRHFTQATTLDPAFALGWQNLASARFETGDHAGALDAAETALRLAPTLALARFTRAVLRLAQDGDQKAWQDYEARLAVWAAQRPFTVPRWSGLPVGRDDAPDPKTLTLLVHAEQGLGDTLQFFRFVPLLAARIGHVVLEVPPALLRLLAPAAAAAGVTLLAEGAPLPPVDAHCPLASLPLALGIDRVALDRVALDRVALDRVASDQGMPDPVRLSPPYLWPPGSPAPMAPAGTPDDVDDRRVQSVRSWAGRIATRLKRRETRPAGPLRVGLAWSGRRPDLTRHVPDDAALAAPAPASSPVFDKRAIPLDALSPLFALNGIEWHVLQTEIDDGDRETLTALAERSSIVFASDAFQDFADTATTVAQLDQVLSIDTSVAHLAGALAAPLTVMLPFAADWRWEARDAAGNNLWYPTAQLFRQHARGDWGKVVQAVAERLASAVSEAAKQAR